MPKPTEHKSVQSRILKYAQEIGWTFVSQSEAEQCRVHELEFEEHATDSAQKGTENQGENV